MGFKRVANFFLNKEEDTSGNKPQYRGKIKLDKDVMKGEEILISGNRENNCAFSLSIIGPRASGVTKRFPLPEGNLPS